MIGIALLALWIFLWRSMMLAIGTLAWVVLVALGLILGVGMSWAIVR